MSLCTIKSQDGPKTHMILRMIALLMTPSSQFFNGMTNTNLVCHMLRPTNILNYQNFEA